METPKRKRILLIEGTELPSNTVIELVKAGYVLEWNLLDETTPGRIKQQYSLYDVIVIGGSVEREKQHELLRAISIVEGDAVRLLVPVVCVDLRVPRIIRLQDLVLVPDQFDAIADGVKRALADLAGVMRRMMERTAAREAKI